jgi:hypothetical protein
MIYRNSITLLQGLTKLVTSGAAVLVVAEYESLQLVKSNLAAAGIPCIAYNDLNTYLTEASSVFPNPFPTPSPRTWDVAKLTGKPISASPQPMLVRLSASDDDAGGAMWEMFLKYGGNRLLIINSDTVAGRSSVREVTRLAKAADVEHMNFEIAGSYFGDQPYREKIASLLYTISAKFFGIAVLGAELATAVAFWDICADLGYMSVVTWILPPMLTDAIFPTPLMSISSQAVVAPSIWNSLSPTYQASLPLKLQSQLIGAVGVRQRVWNSEAYTNLLASWRALPAAVYPGAGKDATLSLGAALAYEAARYVGLSLEAVADSVLDSPANFSLSTGWIDSFSGVALGVNPANPDLMTNFGFRASGGDLAQLLSSNPFSVGGASSTGSLTPLRFDGHNSAVGSLINVDSLKVDPSTGRIGWSTIATFSTVSGLVPVASSATFAQGVSSLTNYIPSESYKVLVPLTGTLANNYLLAYDSKAKTNKFTGAIVEIFAAVMAGLGKNYTLSPFDGSHDDAIKYMTSSSQFDMVLGDVEITATRSGLADFSAPYLVNNYVLVGTSVYSPVTGFLTIFTAPFSPLLWVAFFATVVIAACSLFWIERGLNLQKALFPQLPASGVPPAPPTGPVAQNNWTPATTAGAAGLGRGAARNTAGTADGHEGAENIHFQVSASASASVEEGGESLQALEESQEAITLGDLRARQMRAKSAELVNAAVVCDALWVAWLMMFQRHPSNKVRTLFGRIIMWSTALLFGVLTLSYVAALAASLVFMRQNGPITSLDQAVATGARVGYVQSQVYDVATLLSRNGVSRPVELFRRDNIPFALASGGNADTVVDGLIYSQIFVAQQCGYAIWGANVLPSKWGYAFRKGVYVVPLVSAKIQELTQSGVVSKIMQNAVAAASAAKTCKQPASTFMQSMTSSSGLLASNFTYMFMALYLFAGVAVGVQFLWDKYLKQVALPPLQRDERDYNLGNASAANLRRRRQDSRAGSREASRVRPTSYNYDDDNQR